MKKLELKHLAPYLPYNISFMANGHDYVLTLDNLARRDKTDTLKYIKPILRPMSDMRKDFFINGEQIDMSEEIYSTSWMTGGFSEICNDNYITIISEEDKSKIKVYISKPHLNRYWIFEILLQYHFDVFLLIEKGLAIDINML